MCASVEVLCKHWLDRCLQVYVFMHIYTLNEEIIMTGLVDLFVLHRITSIPRKKKIISCVASTTCGVE